jgi:hypothetical protein
LCYRAGVRGTSRLLRPRRPERPVRRPRPLPAAELSFLEQHASPDGTLAEPPFHEPRCAGAQRRRPCVQWHEQPPFRPVRPDARRRSVRTFCKHALPHHVRIEVRRLEDRAEMRGGKGHSPSRNDIIPYKTFNPLLAGVKTGLTILAICNDITTAFSIRPSSQLALNDWRSSQKFMFHYCPMISVLAAESGWHARDPIVPDW